jgi:hypothetical protein
MGVPALLDGRGVEGLGKIGHIERLAMRRCSINTVKR